MKYIFLIIFLICGCLTADTEIQLPSKDDIIDVYDINSLKTEDKTYKIVDKQDINVYVKGKKQSVKFNENWFIVHSDIIKTMNENQDFIINNIKNSNKREYKFILVCVFILIILSITSTLIRR